MLNTNARYRCSDYDGIAFHFLGYKTDLVYDENWDYEEVEDRQWAEVVMVGDDTVHTVDVDTLTEISEDEYCPECGQIGCKAYG